MKRSAIIQGYEHLILLPIVENKTYSLSSQWARSVPLEVGEIAVVVSGYAVDEKQPTGWFWIDQDGDGDNAIQTAEYELVIGPLWERVQQVAPMVTISSILSVDSDEVDYSRWVIKSCSWKEIAFAGGKRIQLSFAVEYSGEGNGFVNFAYQATATGWLATMPTIEQVSTGSE